MDTTKVWDWFVAALIHDLGKTSLDETGSWEPHKDLAKKGFGSVLPKDLIDRVRLHHDPVDTESKRQTTEATALIMADRFQKGMHGTKDLEKNRDLNCLKNNPIFYPYYGKSEEWNRAKSEELTKKIRGALDNEGDLESLLKLQNYLNRYPHTSYLPHLSLALHNQFTALIFYFLIKRAMSTSLPSELILNVITVTPEALALFYRLRDVESHKRAISFLRKELFKRVFKREQNNLPGLQFDCNPFEFFDGGNSLVVVYDEAKEVLEALQEVLDEKEFLRSLAVELRTFRLMPDPNERGFFGTLSPDSPITHVWTMLARNSLNYPAISLERCGSCGKPQERLDIDIKGDSLCQACIEERQQVRDKAEVVDIHQLSMMPTVEEGKVAYGKVAYVFIALKEPLFEQATGTAKELLSEFSAVWKTRLELSELPGAFSLLRPSKGGLFEYLQAIKDIQAMQQDIAAILQEDMPRSAYTLIRFPSLTVYLMREEHYWDFLGLLREVREKLKLPHCVRGIVCDAKTPFWSLMDRFTSYDEQDYYCDASEGSIVMFTKEEVSQVRDIAKIAEEEWRSSAQLMALSRFGINHNLDELLLELDVRAGQRKLTRSLANALKTSLNKMAGETPKEQTKRAKFIDYITKLARAQSDSKKRR